jgi:uncharacterized alpha-E superfamily protein
MGRYTERAENTARMLDVTYQTSLLPQPKELITERWKKIISDSHLESLFEKKYKSYNKSNILKFMMFDETNPSSIVSCLTFARANARVIRGRITSEVWETQNSTWLGIIKFKPSQYANDPSSFLEWVKYRSHLFRGVTYGTMLADDSLHFMEIGANLERADNTARILNLQYHQIARISSKVKSLGLADNFNGDFFDFYHWVAILRSVSAFEIYRQIYSEQITPVKIIELLVFNAQLPRSLTSCLSNLIKLMSQMKNPKFKEIGHLIQKMQLNLKTANHEELPNQLEEFLKFFLEEVNNVADEFSKGFLIPLNS